jgi:iron complex transport system substrate-binding protein
VIGDLRQNVQVLSTIFGTEVKGEDLLASVDTRIEELQSAAASAGTGLVIMVSGGELTALAPGGHRGGLIYTTLGIAPPVEDVEAATHGEAISFEFLLEHNPDWLFVIDRDVATGEAEGASAEEVLDNNLVHETTAWQEGQIVYLDPFTWYITMGGVTSVQEMLGQLETAFGLAQAA